MQTSYNLFFFRVQCGFPQFSRASHGAIAQRDPRRKNVDVGFFIVDTWPERKRSFSGSHQVRRTSQIVVRSHAVQTQDGDCATWVVPGEMGYSGLVHVREAVVCNVELLAQSQGQRLDGDASAAPSSDFPLMGVCE